MNEKCYMCVQCCFLGGVRIAPLYVWPLHAPPYKTSSLILLVFFSYIVWSNKLEQLFMGEYYHPRRPTSREMSPQLGLLTG